MSHIDHIVSLGKKVEIVGVRYWSPLEQYIVVLHHADHHVIVGSRVEQVCRAHRQWPENVWAHGDGYVVGGHAVIWFVLNYFSHELDNEFESVPVLLG